MAGGTRWTVRFDERDVPCDSRTLGWVFDTLRDKAARASAEAHDLLADLPRDDATAAHRFLLDVRAPVRRTSIGLYFHIEDDLKRLRPHSRLYTPRSCGCLREAWTTALAAVDEQLVDTQHHTWAVAAGDRWYADQFGQLTVAMLSGYTNLYRSAPPARLEVTRNDTTVTMAVGRGRHATTWTFTALTVDERTLADLVRWNGVQQLRAAGSWVRTWPEHVRQVMTELGAGVRLRDTLPAAAQHLLVTAPLTARERQVVRALAPQWHGTATQLLATAAGVARDAT